MKTIRTIQDIKTLMCYQHGHRKNMTDFSTEDLKELYHELMMCLYDKKPYHIRYGKSGKAATIYNEIGVILAVNVPPIEGLQPVRTKREFVFVDCELNAFINRIKWVIAVRKDLPVFQNGRLQVNTQKKVLEYLTE